MRQFKKNVIFIYKLNRNHYNRLNSFDPANTFIVQEKSKFEFEELNKYQTIAN